jgi:predicted peptidase
MNAFQPLLASAICLAVLLAGCASTPPRPAVPPATLLQRTVTVDGQPHAFAIWVPQNYNPKTPCPCVVFLHGSGECGTDGLKQTKVGLPPAAKADPEQWPCIIVMPQKPVQEAEWEEYEPMVLATLNAAKQELNVDPKRTSLTGLSQGGHGTWMIGSRHRELFSALAPVCGYAHPTTIVPRVWAKPIWVFHGEKDEVVPAAQSRNMVEALKRHHQQPEPRLTIYPDLGHNCWDRAYGSEGLGLWLTSQVKP